MAMRWRSLAGGALLIGCADAWGQVEPSPPSETQPSSGVLDEVVVTARRKTERSLDVPISLTVLDGQSLGEAGLTLATDIQERVPGLVVSVPNARLTSFTIRGLGSSSANDGIESSVGLFLDGVYLGRQGLSIFDLIDLERVEILRGPQGTLFGKNTTAGAISIVTRAPTDDFESRLEGTAGNLGARQLRGSINDSLITGELAGRMTAYLSQRDGTVENVFDGDKLNTRNKYGARGQLLWTPLQSISGRLILEYGNNHEICCAFPLTAPVRRPVRERDAYMEYTRVGTDPAERRTDSDAPTRSDMRQMAASAEVSWALSDVHQVTSISAWRDWFFLPLNDDATSLHLASTSTLNQHSQLSQELRLTSNFNSFDTVLGLYYIHQRLDGLERVILGDDLVGWVFGGLIRERALPFATESNSGAVLYAIIPPETLDGMTVDTRYFQTADSVAPFGALDWHVTERLDWSFGLRYTYEMKDSAVARTRYGGNPDATILSTGDPLFGIAQPLLPLVEPITGVIEELIGTPLPTRGFNGILDDVAGGEYARETGYSEGDFSGQTSLSYKLTADTVGYGSVALGYKGGGINLGFTGESIEPTFRPEQAISYEAGLKARLFSRLSLNFAVYQTDVKDYQALTFDNEKTFLPNPRQINLLNVGRVRLRGAELEGYGMALPGLLLRAGLAYSDARTTEFPNAPNEDTRENDKDLSGERLYNAPEWSGNAGAEYTWLIGARLAPYLGVDYSYRTGYFGTVEHGRASYIEGYGLANVRGGLRREDQGWDVSAWARNVTGEDYVSTVYPLYGVGDYGAVPGDPRTFGLTLRMELR